MFDAIHQYVPLFSFFVWSFFGLASLLVTLQFLLVELLYYIKTYTQVEYMFIAVHIAHWLFLTNLQIDISLLRFQSGLMIRIQLKY